MLGAAHSFLERKLSRVLREPPSVRVATGVIVSATAVVVVGSGALIWALDHSEYPNIWVGMWWALQTVTTVGYGDVSPTNPSGRIIASFVMLYGVAFVTIFIAAITSIFVARAAAERGSPRTRPSSASRRGWTSSKTAWGGWKTCFAN
jgi:voltage-gated potassium channel